VGGCVVCSGGVLAWRIAGRCTGAVLEEIGAVRSCTVDLSLRRSRCVCEALRRLYEPALRLGA
jgi:hypothetical protein